MRCGAKRRARAPAPPGTYLPASPQAPRVHRRVGTAACALGPGALHAARGRRRRTALSRGHLKSQAAAFKGTAGLGHALCEALRRWPAAGQKLRGAVDCAMPGLARAVPRREGVRGPRCGGKRAPKRARPLGPRAWVPRRPRGLRSAGRVGAGRPKAPRPGHRAGSPPRAKMSAGEKINPCVAAAALPLASSPPPPPSFPGLARRRRRGRCFFLKRPHQALALPLSRQGWKGRRARLPGGPGRPGGGFATAAAGLRTEIPL